MDPALAKIVDKTLDKIPVDKIYEDLAQPVFRKAGKALADILDIITTPLLPALQNRKMRELIFNDNLKRYEETLQARDRDPIEVLPELGVPILQKLIYTSQGELADAFIKLLANASFDDTVHQVHPAFVTTLSDLSRDEAVILKTLDPNSALPVLSVNINYMHKDDPDEYSFTRAAYPMLAGIEKELELHFPQNINLYLHNFQRLGIFLYNDSSRLIDETRYKKIEDLYVDEIENAREFAIKSEAEKGQKASVHLNREVLNITPFGREFIKACLS